jgi:hypothetical protein
MSSIGKFVERSRKSGLPYVTESIASLRDGSAKLASDPESIVPVSADDLLHIYTRRAERLSSVPTDHAKIMTVDAKMLCESLRELAGRACRIWLIEREPYFIYSFFETVDDQRFFGVIKSVDDRKLSATDRVTFWGTK